jgi:Zn-dependent M16 (insulinase) family peptidase
MVTHPFSIGTAADAEADSEDGLFRNIVNKSLRGGAGIKGSFASPNLPVSRPPSRRFNLWRYIMPDESEYDSIYRSQKQRRKRFMIGGAAVLVLVVVLSAVLTADSAIVESGDSASINAVVPHNAYAVAQKGYIADIQANMVLYRHKKTQAEVLTIIPDDPDQDSVFGLSVRTLAEDNNGAPHVLMRALWDGSERFPLKDPVHEYHKGSLATYIQAMTMEDRTTYIAASRNRKDFQNLQAIMLDALYAPLLRKDDHKDWIFREEAWRIDPFIDATTIDAASLFDPNNEHLQFNGNTLNWQKAIYTDPDEMLTRYARRALFGNTRYQFDAQGVPSDIIQLRPQDMQNYYAKHYVATNTQVYVYGSLDDVADGLQAFEDYAKKQQPRMDKVDTSLASWQNLNLKKPAEEIHSYPADETDESSSNGFHVTTSWLLNDHKLTTKDEFAWHVIESLLIGTSISIIRKSLQQTLEEQQNSTAFVPVEVLGGLDTTYQQWRFSVTVKGLRHDQVRPVHSQIDDVVSQITEFSQAELDAAMNVVEMTRRDLSSGRAGVPRGVKLFHQVLEHWTYNKEPKDTLSFSEGWNELQSEIRKNGPAILLNLIQTQLVQNTHKVRVQLFPRQDETVKQAKAEKQRLLLMRETMSEDEFGKILQESLKLQQVQGNLDPPSVYDMLPRLDLSDIPPKNAKRTASISINHRVTLAETRVVSSFGMFFIDFGVDLGGVRYEDIPLLPLVYQLMLESGTEHYGREELIHRIGKFSTGIAAESMILDARQDIYQGPLQFKVHDGIHLATKVFFRGRCKADNLEDYLNLLAEIVFHGRAFSQNAAIDILNQMIGEQEAKLETEGHILVARRLDSRYSNQGIIEEQLFGMYQLQKLHWALLEAFEDWSGLLQRLARVHVAIIEGNRNGMILGVTSDKKLLETNKPVIDAFLATDILKNDNGKPFKKPGDAPHPWVEEMLTSKNDILPFTDEALIVATTVDYVGKGGQLFHAADRVDGSVAVVAKYLEREYLYKELHEKRGAANAFAQFNHRHGTLMMISYKDPHLATTLDVYDEAGNALTQSIVSKDSLPSGAREAIVGTIADWDGTAKQPDQIGWDYVVAYLRDDNFDFEQQWRHEMLNTTRQDFVDFVNYLLEWTNPSVAVVSNVESYLKLKNETLIDLKVVCQHFTCRGDLFP